MGNIMDMPLWCWKEDDVEALAFSPRPRPLAFSPLRGRGPKAETGVKKNNYVVSLKTRERQKKIRINSFFL